MTDRDEIERLLSDLTAWRLAAGPRPGPDSEIASTGESVSAMDNIEGKLAALGARYRWSEEERAYRLIESDAT